MFASSGLSRESTWRHNPEDGSLQIWVCYEYKYAVDDDMAANRTVTVFKFWNTDAANRRLFPTVKKRWIEQGI
jgi:hypothetical protein